MTKSSNVFAISLMYSMILNLSKIDSMIRSDLWNPPNCQVRFGKILS